MSTNLEMVIHYNYNQGRYPRKVAGQKKFLVTTTTEMKQ